MIGALLVLGLLAVMGWRTMPRFRVAVNAAVTMIILTAIYHSAKQHMRRIAKEATRDAQ